MIVVGNDYATLTEFCFSTIKGDIRYTDFIQNGFDVKIKSATNNDELMSFSRAILNKFNKTIPQINVRANKLLENILWFCYQAVLPSVTFLYRYFTSDIISLDFPPIIRSEILTNENTHVVPDDGPVKITLNNHNDAVPQSSAFILTAYMPAPALIL
jgi:hypothetical protein